MEIPDGGGVTPPVVTVEEDRLSLALPEVAGFWHWVGTHYAESFEIPDGVVGAEPTEQLQGWTLSYPPGAPPQSLIVLGAPAGLGGWTQLDGLGPFLVDANATSGGSNLVALHVGNGDTQVYLVDPTFPDQAAYAGQLPPIVEAADLILHGLSRTIAAKTVTYDFARLMDGATEVKCSEFADHIIRNMV